MKKTTKLVLMSVVTIALCISLIAGATFALFTDDDSVNITVSSGKVDVVAEIDTESLVTYSYDANAESEEDKVLDHLWGGTAKFDVDGNLEITNMVPYDGVEFNINITNYSTVVTKWQLQMTCDGDILDTLDVTISGLNGLTMTDVGSTKVSNWETLSAAKSSDGEPVATITVKLEMPVKATAQDQSGIISVAVYAVQGNAQTFNSTADFVDAAQNGGNITLTSDIDVSSNAYGVELNGNVDLTVDGNGKTIAGNRSAFYYNDNSAESKGTITFKNVHFKAETFGFGYAFMLGNSSKANVVFENCTFEDMYTAVYVNKNEIEDAATITIQGCTFINTTWCYSVDADPASVKVIFGDDNTIEGWHVGEKEDFDASYFVKAGADAAANGKKLQNAINKAQEGETIYVSAGTYEATANDQYRLIANNVTLVGAGEGKTIINASEYSCSGQAAILVSGNNCTIANLTIQSSSTNGNVATIKVTNVGTTQELPVVKGFNLKNVTIEGAAGHGLNLHGVEGATIDGLTVASYGKCAIALARATGVVIENTTTAVAGWGYDIGFMYGSGSAFATASSATVGFDTCAFGNGRIYSERPAVAGMDMIYGDYGDEWEPTGNGPWELVKKA